jgi:hypothetical protein
MIIYEISPEFESCRAYQLFFQKVGGQYWKDINNAISNLTSVLRDDKEFALSLFKSYKYESEDEEFDVSFDGNIITITFLCQARDIVFKKVTNKVTVDGKEFYREESVREDRCWYPKSSTFRIPIIKIKTSD